MPVVRNPQFNFKEGFCWNNILNPNARLLKVKLKKATVNDVGSMSLSTKYKLPNFYYVSLLNSNLLFDYYREFINCTVNIQINDLRQLPIIIPTQIQLDNICLIFNQIFNLKIEKSSSNIFKLSSLEKELDNLILSLYTVDFHY